MASVARLRVPLVASIRTYPLQTCTRVRLSPQLQARFPRTFPSSSTARTFRTSTAFQEKQYTTDHEWIELSEDGKTGTIGVSVYAANALGDVVFVELPTLDTSVAAGDSIGAVESVKSASDIMTPASGKIVGVNEVLQEKPGTINKSPEGEGWIAKIEITDSEELKDLMAEDAYGKFVAE
ncbi:hypothetical protein N7G274_000270 [Stereocaulon virgatum]|uniref:Glycine cleavage system H protein n=1 Tax=Stereocaulon virgatum TaxID=373712 RepID=A0ABR4ARM6_9LECA